MLPVCSKAKSNMEPRLRWEFSTNYVSVTCCCPVSTMSACSCFPRENCQLADAVGLNWVDIVNESSKQQEKHSKMRAICIFLLWLSLALSLTVLKSQQLYPTIFLSQKSLNGSGWQGPQWVIWSSLSVQAGSSQSTLHGIVQAVLQYLQ